MRLSEYLRESGYFDTGGGGYSRFAKEAGLNRTTVVAIAKGFSNPQVNIAEKIVMATGEAVGFTDLIKPEQVSKAAS